MMRIAAVEYINTVPFLQAIESEFSVKEVRVFKTHPAACANLYYDGAVDLALVPTGTLDLLPSHKVVTDYCIGSDGPVDTVAILSQLRIDQLRSISLDHHSRTSAKLIKLLCSEYWKLSMEFLPETAEDKPNMGRLLIGDKVKKYESQYVHKTDLGFAWQQWTQLPMVYAVWIANERITNTMIHRLNGAFKKNIEVLSHIELSHVDNEVYWRSYLQKNIRYALDKRAKIGLSHFLSKTK